MYVGYKPTFTITVSQSTFKSFVEKFKTSIGLRIGPFTFNADGGSEKSGWNASQAGSSFTGTSTSDSPLILGVTIARLPTQVDGADALAADADAEPRGVAYRFEDSAGDVLGYGVTESESRALGARSWKPDAARLGTRHAHDVRIVPLYGDPVLENGLASIDFNGPTLTELRAGIFAVNKPLPTVNTEYTVSGSYDVGALPFVYHLRCTNAGRPMSRFAP